MTKRYVSQLLSNQKSQGHSRSCHKWPRKTEQGRGITSINHIHVDTTQEYYPNLSQQNQINNVQSKENDGKHTNWLHTCHTKCVCNFCPFKTWQDLPTCCCCCLIIKMKLIANASLPFTDHWHFSHAARFTWTEGPVHTTHLCTLTYHCKWPLARSQIVLPILTSGVNNTWDRTRAFKCTAKKRVTVVFLKTTKPHALFTPQWYLGNLMACLRRCVCMWALIG